MKRVSLIFLLSGLLLSCDLGDNPITVFSYNFDLSKSAEGWDGDFSDYPEGDSLLFDLEFDYTLLPENISKTRKGLKVSGTNYSDDLFMFIKRKITGLKPNTEYMVMFNVRFASNAPTGDFGVGGAPGENVIVKVGATQTEPKKVLASGYYQMNIDKGNQAQQGADALVIGHVGVNATTTQYSEIYRNNNSGNPFYVTTTNEGEVWVCIGTDSGFEGNTTLYYTSVDILFNQE